MNNNIARYEKLKTKRPSIVRASALSFIYWPVCSLLAFVFLVLGCGILFYTGFADWLQTELNVQKLTDYKQAFKLLIYFLSGTFILLSLLFFIIARLSKKIIRRTNYIVSLEEVMDSELNPEPNYVEI